MQQYPRGHDITTNSLGETIKCSNCHHYFRSTGFELICAKILLNIYLLN